LDARDGPDGVVVTEWLEAKASAIGAIAGAVLTLLLLLHSCFPLAQGRMELGDWLILKGTPVVVAIVEVVVLLLVINNTWRRTVLEARRDAVLLRFTAPFGDRRYEWGASEVEDIRMELTTSAAERNSLGELEIHLAGLPLVKLFTDHPALELEALAARLRHAVGLAR
jgi:hypothetical protein